MAAPNFTPISLYYSTVTTNVPTAGNLVNGELAINITDGKLFYKDNAGVVQVIATKASASGDVAGPASATDDAVARFDGTTGKIIQNSSVTITDAGVVSGATQLNVDNVRIDGNDISTTDTNGNLTFTANGTGYYSYSGTQAVLVPKGNNTTERPATPVTGMLRYNNTTNEFEGYSGAVPAWKSVGGAAISNDTTTATSVYPAFLDATSGTASTVYTSNAKLLYRPSDGEFKSSVINASSGLIVNSTTVSSSYTIAPGSNAMSVGPMTVDSGATVTVSSGQRWLIL